MVPKIIHCCWFGGEKTRLARKCRESWGRLAPNWEVREWNRENIEALQHIPGYAFCRAAIEAKKWAMASDWLRMAALWQAGGVYLDFDVELVGDLDSLCKNGEWIASEWIADGETWLNPGSGICLDRGSSLAREMLDEYSRLDFDPNRAMMPWINRKLRDVVERVEKVERVGILAPEVMSPIDVKGRMHRNENTVGIHRYAMSEAGFGRRALKWLSWHGGRGIVDAAVSLKHLLQGGAR